LEGGVAIDAPSYAGIKRTIGDSRSGQTLDQKTAGGGDIEDCNATINIIQLRTTALDRQERPVYVKLKI